MVPHAVGAQAKRAEDGVHRVRAVSQARTFSPATAPTQSEGARAAHTVASVRSSATEPEGTPGEPISTRMRCPSLIFNLCGEVVDWSTS